MDATVLLLPYERLEAAVACARDLGTYAAELGYCARVFASSAAEATGLSVFDGASDPAPVLVVALGGDGTLLHAVHVSADLPAPLLGIKFGRLGFLTGATVEDARRALAAALGGTACTERRTMVHYRALAGTTVVLEGDALNEVVVGRGSQESVVTTALSVNGHHLYTSSGDGLIVATATGSTAYALSAGGPIVSPNYAGMVVVPLASHTLVQRSLVTGPDENIDIRCPDPRRGCSELVIDGSVRALSQPADLVFFAASERTVELVKLDSRLFYDTVASVFFSGQQ